MSAGSPRARRHAAIFSRAPPPTAPAATAAAPPGPIGAAAAGRRRGEASPCSSSARGAQREGYPAVEQRSEPPLPRGSCHVRGYRVWLREKMAPGRAPPRCREQTRPAGDPWPAGYLAVLFLRPATGNPRSFRCRPAPGRLGRSHPPTPSPPFLFGSPVFFLGGDTSHGKEE